jgi:hypothetical protein
MREIVAVEEKTGERTTQMVAIVSARELRQSHLSDEDVRQALDDVFDTVPVAIAKGIVGAFGGDVTEETDVERRLRRLRPGVKSLLSRGVFIEEREISGGRTSVVARHVVRWPPNETPTGPASEQRNPPARSPDATR